MLRPRASLLYYDAPRNASVRLTHDDAAALADWFLRSWPARDARAHAAHTRLDASRVSGRPVAVIGKSRQGLRALGDVVELRRRARKPADARIEAAGGHGRWTTVADAVDQRAANRARGTRLERSATVRFEPGLACRLVRVHRVEDQPTGRVFSGAARRGIDSATCRAGAARVRASTLTSSSVRAACRAPRPTRSAPSPCATARATGRDRASVGCVASAVRGARTAPE